MTSLNYVGNGWPRIFSLVINVPSFTNATDPVYPLGSATFFWTPPAGNNFFIRKMRLGGILSAVGTDLVVQCTAYKSEIGTPNIAMNMVTAATSDPGDVDVSTTTAPNADDGMDFITENDGLLIRVQFSAGDTGTWSGGTVTIEGEYQ